MVKSLVCFFFLLEAFISRTCLSHSETSGGPHVSVLLSLSHSLTQFPLPWARGRKRLLGGWVRRVPLPSSPWEVWRAPDLSPTPRGAGLPQPLIPGSCAHPPTHPPTQEENRETWFSYWHHFLFFGTIERPAVRVDPSLSPSTYLSRSGLGRREFQGTPPCSSPSLLSSPGPRAHTSDLAQSLTRAPPPHPHIKLPALQLSLTHRHTDTGSVQTTKKK